MALVMRIKFPPTYPLIYKTLRIDAKLTTNEAIQFISETLNVAIQGNVGLYIPQEKMWLEPNTPLSNYDQLQEVEEVEFRDRDSSDDGNKPKPANSSGGCCILY
ncbi:FERM domain-containing protein [Balamuthia mandrillaris]